MPRTGATRGHRAEGTGALAVVLRGEEQGPALAVGLVSDRDLADARAELWFEAFLRRGYLDVPPEDVRAEPRPILRDEGTTGTCLGFSLACETPGGETVRRVFGRSCLEPVARRLVSQLAAAKPQEEDERLVYEVVARPRGELEARPAAVRREPSAVRVVGTAAKGLTPFPLLSVPLSPLLELSEEVLAADTGERDHPVFLTREARERAEAAARRGAADRPPVETGGLLVGPLCRCPETGELFAVVTDVIEAAHSEGTKYSLTYSGRTWERIQSVMRAMRARPATRCHRLLGQVHGHSFLPMDGAEPCEECAALEVCTRTTAFLSPDDRTWCRAVFHCQPWQLSQVHGLDARGRGVEAFYGQRGGVLVRRSYRVLERFEPPSS